MPPYTTITTRFELTRPSSRYSDYMFAPQVLHQLAEHFKSGRMPVQFNHDPTHRLDGRVIDAEVVSLPNGETAIDVTVEIELGDWQEVQDAVAAEGGPGGFSFSMSSSLVRSDPAREASVTLAADPAAWTQDQLEDARVLLDAVVPTDSALLFQFSAAVEIATIALVLTDIATGVLGNAAYDAIKLLVRARAPKGMTRVEIRRPMADGTEVIAVVVTDDPDIAQQALTLLPEMQTQPVILFDDDSWDWPEG
ncbi:hypothetical protein [Baekduia sp. Peel2402]|uniref:hypothetical protein n=1 Tax=Baekduia sp. Peel2402 TaxID=3458296 RepID=UPI00403E932E